LVKKTANKAHQIDSKHSLIFVLRSRSFLHKKKAVFAAIVRGVRQKKS
jgi:hypothetical protein